MFYIYWTQEIINWVLDPLASNRKGSILVAVYMVCAMSANFMKRSVINEGLIMSLKIRKILVTAMYDKLGKLSMTSVTSTDSGKLITLVSADIFTIERGLAFAPIALTSPFVNIGVVIFIGVKTHWSNAIVVLGFYVAMIILQLMNGEVLKGQ